MADNETTGTGKAVATDKVTYSGDADQNVQLIRPVAVTGSEGAKTVIDHSYGSGVVDTGTQRFVLATDVALPAGTNNIGDVDVLSVPAPLSTAGGGTEATALRVTIANDSTGVVSIDDNGASITIDGTVTANLAAGTNNIGDVDVLSVPAPLSTAGGGTEATALRVTIANDSTGVVSIDDNGASITVDGTVTANLAAGTNNIGDVDVLTVNGVAPAFGSGVRGATVQRVTIATDDVVPASQSGNWTVQPGNTANTTPWLVTQTPATSGGLTTYHLVSAATTNATNIKASAGQVYGWYIYNNNAAVRKVAFHNTAGTPTAGASVFFSLVIPANSGANVAFPSGIAFSTGIAITTVTEVTDAGSTAVGLNDLIINIFYK